MLRKKEKEPTPFDKEDAKHVKAFNALLTELSKLLPTLRNHPNVFETAGGRAITGRWVVLDGISGPIGQRLLVLYTESGKLGPSEFARVQFVYGNPERLRSLGYGFDYADRTLELIKEATKQVKKLRKLK